VIRFSKSKLNTFLACPEKYRLMYELGLRAQKASRTLVEGSAIHHLVETGLMQRNRNDAQDILEMASDAFWHDHPLDQCDYETEEAYQDAQIRCLDQSQAFLDQLGPLPVRHVELQLDSPLIHPITGAEDASISLLGYLDLVLLGEDGSPYLIDLKTVARRPQEGMSRVALELSMYAYLYSAPFEEVELTSMPVALVYLVRTKEPQVVWDESRRSLHHYIELHRICRKVARDIAQEHFYRNPGMHCSWCDCRPLCFQDAESAYPIFGEELVNYYLHDRETREMELIQLGSHGAADSPSAEAELVANF